MIEVQRLRVISGAGKSSVTKGAFAEAYADLPEDAFAGTVQNMQRTVTVVERYLKIFDNYGFLLRYTMALYRSFFYFPK